MTPQIFIYLSVPVVAIGMFIVGYLVAAYKKKASIADMINEYDGALASLSEERDTLRQQLNESLNAQRETYHAYASANNNFLRSRQYIEKLLNYDKSLAQNFARMQQDYARLYNERASLLKKIKSTSSLSLPTPQDYQRTKQELTQTRANLFNQRQEIESLRKTHSTLSEEKKMILGKLQKVYSAYKKISSRATQLQQIAKITDTLRLEKDKLHSMYAETLEKLKQHERQTELMQRVENERNEMALKIDVLQAQIAEMESIREENKILFEQNQKIDALQRNLSLLESENAVLRAKNLVIEKPQN